MEKLVKKKLFWIGFDEDELFVIWLVEFYIGVGN